MKTDIMIKKNTYLLVHGAWHGEWVWEELKKELGKQGHQVFSIDLPGSGDDKTPLLEVSLQSYTDQVCFALESLTDVILVGHSMGGIVITQAGEVCTDKIKSLVYLTAILPENGQSLMTKGQERPASDQVPYYDFSPDGVSSTIKPEKIKEILCNDCTAEQIAYVKSKLTPQANRPLGEPVSITEANYGSIPRYYIECTLDNTIPIESQREMYDHVKCNEVFTLESSHSPFISMPDKLGEILSLL